mmetsp:Transcript_21733/g.61035  ORF Transcript_21733/g.61035 Transcript_21733/m.61035 type:complete len:241 (-) Transcript_21733:272-994(-)
MEGASVRRAQMRDREPLIEYIDAEDAYFADEPGIVSAFDFDYDTIVGFETKLTYMGLLAGLPFSILSSLCCYPCFAKRNIEWSRRAQHVALTVDGIKYVVARHPSRCGLPCSDVGKKSKTVPYDKITDCDVEEPAGTACCCCIENVLSHVHIDTASSGPGKTEEGAPIHELSITGLRYPVEFKRSVWAMKRGDAIPCLGYAGRGAPAGAAAAPAQQAMETQVLSEILGELRQLNTLMRAK